MKCFKLKNRLTISDVCEGQTIFTDHLPYVYLSSNGIYFSKERTMNPLVAFKRSAKQLFFYCLENASMAFDAIHRAACAGYDRIDIDEQDPRDISFRFVDKGVNNSNLDC